MSPEQARGKALDKRTDWSFGGCLFQALAGKIAFLGPTVSGAIAAILEHELRLGSDSHSNPRYRRSDGKRSPDGWAHVRIGR